MCLYMCVNSWLMFTC